MLYFTIGVIVGAIVSALWQHLIMGHGTLRIDHSDPEKDIYRLEIDSLDQIDRKIVSMSKWTITRIFRKINSFYYGTLVHKNLKGEL